MFLDAWLGLAFAGTVAFIILSAVLLASIFALVYGFKIRRERPIAATLISTCGTFFLIAIVALSIYVFGEHRVDKQVVLDLRKPRNEMLLDLAKSCATKITDESCDSTRYKLSALIIFDNGLQLPLSLSGIHWSAGVNQPFGYISLIGSQSLPLSSGRDILLSNASLLSEKSNNEIQKQISEASEWLAKVNKSKAYSETFGVILRPGFGMQFRKNIDSVSIDYSITSSY